MPDKDNVSDSRSLADDTDDDVMTDGADDGNLYENTTALRKGYRIQLKDLESAIRDRQLEKDGYKIEYLVIDKFVLV